MTTFIQLSTPFSSSNTPSPLASKTFTLSTLPPSHALPSLKYLHTHKIPFSLGYYGRRYVYWDRERDTYRLDAQGDGVNLGSGAAKQPNRRRMQRPTENTSPYSGQNSTPPTRRNAQSTQSTTTFMTRSRKHSVESNKSSYVPKSPHQFEQTQYDSSSPYVSESDDDPRYTTSPSRRTIIPAHQRRAMYRSGATSGSSASVPHISDYWMCLERVPSKWMESAFREQITSASAEIGELSDADSTVMKRRSTRSTSVSSVRTDLSEALEENAPMTRCKDSTASQSGDDTPLVDYFDAPRDYDQYDENGDDDDYDDDTDQYVIVAWNNREAFRRQFQRGHGTNATESETTTDSPLPFTSSCAYLTILKFEYKPQQSLLESNFIENQLRLSLVCNEQPQSATYLKPRRSHADTILRFKKSHFYGVKLSLLDSSTPQQYTSPKLNASSGNLLSTALISGGSSPSPFGSPQQQPQSSMNLGDMELIAKSLQWRIMADKSASLPSGTLNAWNMGKLEALHLQTKSKEYFQFWFDDANEMSGRTLTDEEQRRIIFRTCFELRGIIRVVFFVDFICTADHLIYETRDPLPIDGATFRYSDKLRMWKIKSIIRKPSGSISGPSVALPATYTQLTCLGLDVHAGPSFREHYRKLNIANLTYLVHPGQLRIKLADNTLNWSMNSDAHVIVDIPALQPGHYELSFFSNDKQIERVGLVYEILSDASDIESASYQYYQPDDAKRNALNQDVSMQLVIQNDFDKLMSALAQKESDVFEVDFLQRSAFHLAMILNHPKCAALLLLFGGEEITFHRDLFGMTALEAGRFFGHHATVQRVEAFWKKYASLASKGTRKEYYDSVEKFFLTVETPKYRVDEVGSPLTGQAPEDNPFE